MSKMIEIFGYVIKAYNSNFTLHVINDNIKNEQGIHPNISKEIEISIDTQRYPDDYHVRFEKIENGQKTFQHKSVKECLSICKGLRKGALVKCKVFIVNSKCEISDDPMQVENYTKYRLFLYPNHEDFKHLEGDIPETLKFRRQNYYRDRNKQKCENITGNSYYQYSTKWWINKNPKIIFPILEWIRIKTALSKLWERFTKQETPISIVWKGAAIISSIIAIWALFFKDK